MSNIMPNFYIVLITAVCLYFYPEAVTAMRSGIRRSYSNNDAPSTSRPRRTLTGSQTFPSRGTPRAWSMSTTADSHPTSQRGSPQPTFESPSSDAQLAFLIQNRDADPCKKISVTPGSVNRMSREWILAEDSCRGALVAYNTLMNRHHITSACSGPPVDAACRYIKRRSTGVWEWTCTVRVRNHFLVAFVCCDPDRIEHLDYCLKTMKPPLTLRSIRYDRSKSLNIPLSSSEGTPSKPTFIPEDDDDDDDF